ncbi:CoA:oxalate CoA-transferase [Lactobacillus colini]|uniref:CoA:oxalate CoA-transferase n=1 Tax=Lactobacillus colini TaxID=1819254 RepID=A0ABS4MF21_9LACO|nr:CoA transferase [Lactobacillus colini]MBP2058281.1 CoA:oxalate CoA-transferase [Lactobacillus colini]
MSKLSYKEAMQVNPHLDKSKPYPLAGLLVVDFTHVLSGPTCTRMLADAGARVIHIERKTGDDTRHIGPYLEDGSSEYFRICNIGKESIALDLKDPKDHDLVENMIAKADIVVENFRPGVMTRLGFDPDEMVKKYPRLIFASISGFGQYGPWAKQSAYDTIVQAFSGIMDATGDANGKATRVGTSVADVVAGIMGYSAITTALVARERTGKGTTVDVSMLDSTFALMVQDLMTVLGIHQIPHRIGNRHPYMYPFDTFECKDQALAICCGNDELWKILSHTLGHDEWTNQSEFKTNDLREKNWQKVKSVMQDVLMTKTASEWDKILNDAGIPAGLILNVNDTSKLDQIVMRGMVKQLPDGNEVIGTPMKFGTWNSYGVQKDAPQLDEDGEKIRKEFE